MADQVFNIAKGRITEFYNRIVSNDPINSAFVLILLKTSEADSTLIDYDTLSAIVVELLNRYPSAEVYGHYELDPNKTCPNFNVQEWLTEESIK